VTTLINAPAVVAWNSDKRYLRDLVDAGVNVVDTSFIEPGDPIELPVGVEFVVKPTVSAGSRDTVRYHADDHAPATAQVEALLADGRTVMVQPYQAAVDEQGETALLFFGGEFSHAIRKGPLLAPNADATAALFAPEQIVARDPAPEERALAQRVLAALPFPGPLLYARVDLLRDAQGAPVLLELELTEPSLFFPFAQGSVERFVEALQGMR
jgi:glutathione synthase/RimK-type ligase-like ATP-grasp enzyme